MKNIYTLILIIIFNFSFAQETLISKPVDTKDYSFDLLEKKIFNYRLKKDFNNAKFYANLFLTKGKKEKNKSKIIHGYLMMASTSAIDSSFIYADSIIKLSKNDITLYHPASAYLLKGNGYASRGNYKEAFSQLAKANEYAVISNNTSQIREIKYIIARLKTKVNDYKSSNTMLLDLLSAINDTDLQENSIKIRTAAIIYSALANNYIFLKHTDSSKIVLKKGFYYSFKTMDSTVYNRLLAYSAISDYQIHNYKSSLDSLIKLEKIEKYRRSGIELKILRHLYKGKIQLQNGQDDLGISNLKKADSLIFSSNHFNTSTRENYELLIDYYKKRNDVKNQLLYINKLLKTDSVLNSNFEFLTKNISTKYTTPNLLLEKQKIIDSLQDDKATKTLFITALTFCLLILGLTLVWNAKKRIIYKKRIEELDKPKQEKTKNKAINNETTARILKQLNAIESSELFLNKDFNLSYLAKTLETNTAYLSKIINEYKEKNFKQYLVELRVNALLDKLDKDPILRKHSIEALAESIGYTNASSFTRIFKNYLGESPSSFLKKRFP